MACDEYTADKTSVPAPGLSLSETVMDGAAPVQLVPVQSSNIAAAGWRAHGASGILLLRFTSGAMVRYENVPREWFDQFLAAESRGRFFAATLRRAPDQHPFTTFLPAAAVNPRKDDEMATETGTGIATAADLRPAARMARMTGGNIKTAAELADRTREMQEQAFILSPMSAVSTIAPGYEITPVVVAIDPSCDPVSGRGADVYFQPSIHKRVDTRDRNSAPAEVSLNHYGLLRILGAVGVNVQESRWTADGNGAERYLWVCETGGTVVDFDGRVRSLPAGIGSLDARDGSPDIGEWTPEEWGRRVAVAEKQREKTPKSEQWKVKPEPIGGWTAERVMQVRKYGRQLAKTKSLNGLARKLGVRQSYTVAELKAKPFVVLRVMYMPDLSNPRIAEMVAAANLGGLATLYPAAAGAPQPQLEAPVSHAYGERGQTLDGAVVEEPERMATAAPPEDAQEVAEEPAAPAAAPAATAPAPETYTVVKVLRKGKDADAQYFVQTKEDIVLFTTDAGLLRPLQAAAKDGQPREIATERVLVAEQPYRQIVEVGPVGGLRP